MVNETKIYYVRKNNVLLIDTPWYKEAAAEYQEAVRTGKRGDRVTISVELNQTKYKLLAWEQL